MAPRPCDPASWSSHARDFTRRLRFAWRRCSDRFVTDGVAQMVMACRPDEVDVDQVGFEDGCGTDYSENVNILVGLILESPRLAESTFGVVETMLSTLADPCLAEAVILPVIQMTMGSCLCPDH